MLKTHLSTTVLARFEIKSLIKLKTTKDRRRSRLLTRAKAANIKDANFEGAKSELIAKLNHFLFREIYVIRASVEGFDIGSC